MDKDAKKIEEIQEFKLPIYEIKELFNVRGIKIVIASIWWREILDDIKGMGITDLDIEIIQIGVRQFYRVKLKKL